MYEGSHFGAHSHSTPASPSPYNSNNSQQQQHQPSSGEGKVAYDRDLSALFRATAANVTQLYKEASEIGNSAYKSGYEQCYNDIWEYFASAAQAEGTLACADGGHQIIIQRLAEFARAKRISPRQQGQADSVNSRPPSAASQLYAHHGHYNYQQQHQQHHQQQQQPGTAPRDGCNLNTQDALEEMPATELHGTPKSLDEILRSSADSHETFDSTVSDLSNVTQSRQHTNEHNITIPNSDVTDMPQRREASLSTNYVSGNPRLLSADSELQRIGQSQLTRNKRALENTDPMDIEPPRRRQRIIDIDMT